MKCIVFGGGAEKGISYIGALQFLEEKNIVKDICSFIPGLILQRQVLKSQPHQVQYCWDFYSTIFVK